MEPNIFSPRIQQATKDKLGEFLCRFSKTILITVFGLLPIFFIPGVYTSLGLNKVYFVILGLFTAFILLCLSVLRSGRLRVAMPLPLALFWLFTFIAIASSLLSGDTQDSLYGNTLEVHTAGFFLVTALIMTVSLAFTDSKSSITRLFTALGASALVLQLFHILRLIFGPEFLSFGIFSSPTVSLIGSFNDLAIFSGLIIIITLIVLQNISTHLVGRVLVSFLVVSSLFLMAVVNFYVIWLIVGFLSLIMTLYLMSKDTWFKISEVSTVPTSRFVLALVGLVCVFSVAFVISGDFISGFVGKAADISYLEIRPSIGATINVTQSVLSENALFGIGPNLFEDAWRKYKDPVINQTVFWSTDFSAGSGFVPTLFATTGIAGGVAFIMFLIAFLYLGYRTLFSVKVNDSGWYLLGTISFTAAIYLWFMAIVYVPGTTILILTALMTGLAFAVYITVVPNTGVIIDVTNNKKFGLLLITAILAIITTSTFSVINISKLYLANIVYADTVRLFHSGGGVSEVDNQLKRSQDLVNQDLFVAERAQLRLAELSKMGTVEPTSFDEQKFSSVLVEGIALAELAITLDRTNPANYVLLSSFYGLLDPTKFEGIKEKNEALFIQARSLDPANPGYLILLAQYKAKIGDLAGARADLMESIKIKNNLTEALLFLSQLDIQEGNTESAIEITRAMISIEPSNPTRYFQLGFLLATTNNLQESVKAFETAVSLDNNYANARYFLALTYLDLDRKEDALTQLRFVLNSNSDNEFLKNLISQIESGTYQKPKNTFETPVQNDSAVSQQEDVTTSSQAPDTDLVTPLNRPVTQTEEKKDLPKESTVPTEEEVVPE